MIGGFFTPNSVQSRLGSTAATNLSATGDPIFGAWRPTVNIDLFYALTETVAIGIENDLFFHDTRRGNEYLSFPFVTWEAGQHSFFQVGGGYYHFEGRDQFTFLLHLNFVNPSVKVSDEEREGANPESHARADEGPEAEAAQGGPVRRWIERRRANR